MKIQAKYLAAVAVSAGLLASAAAGAAGVAPTGQFASTSVLFRGDVVTRAPQPHSVGADAATTAPVVTQTRKPQAPSSYELRSLLVRAPAKPDAVRAQGE